MRSIQLLLFVSAFGGLLLAEEKPKGEPILAEGTWTITEMSLNGKKAVPGETGPDEIIVKDGKMTFYKKGEALNHFKDFTLAVDTKSTPKKMDLITKNSETGARHFLPAIYQVEESELTLGVSLPQPDVKTARHASFEESEKAGIHLKARLKK